MNRPKLYMESSIVSYLTARPSRDIVTAARQQITREWWETRRSDFDLYFSEFVYNEICSGDSEAVSRRLSALEGLSEIRVTETALALAGVLVARGPLPEKAAVDAAHIAVAVSSGIDYLLTWNFKHLANAALRAKIDRVCESFGYEPCIICTPEELMESQDHGTR